MINNIPAASLKPRLIAYVLDTLVLEVLAVSIALVIYLISTKSSTQPQSQWMVVIGYFIPRIVFSFFYHTMSLFGGYGITLGKKICKIRIVKDNQQQLSYMDVMLRFFTYGLEIMLAFLASNFVMQALNHYKISGSYEWFFLLLSIFCAAALVLPPIVTEKRKMLHDFICKTYCVAQENVHEKTV